MGHTEVEIGPESESRLEELQDDLRRETGTCVSKGELLERAIASASLDELLEAFGEDAE